MIQYIFEISWTEESQHKLQTLMHTNMDYDEAIGLRIIFAQKSFGVCCFYNY